VETISVRSYRIIPISSVSGEFGAIRNKEHKTVNWFKLIVLWHWKTDQKQDEKDERLLYYVKTDKEINERYSF